MCFIMASSKKRDSPSPPTTMMLHYCFNGLQFRDPNDIMGYKCETCNFHVCLVCAATTHQQHAVVLPLCKLPKGRCESQGDPTYPAKKLARVRYFVDQLDTAKKRWDELETKLVAAQSELKEKALTLKDIGTRLAKMREEYATARNVLMQKMQTNDIQLSKMTEEWLHVTSIEESMEQVQLEHATLNGRQIELNCIIDQMEKERQTMRKDHEALKQHSAEALSFA